MSVLSFFFLCHADSELGKDSGNSQSTGYKLHYFLQSDSMSINFETSRPYLLSPIFVQVPTFLHPKVIIHILLLYFLSLFQRRVELTYTSYNDYKLHVLAPKIDHTVRRKHGIKDRLNIVHILYTPINKIAECQKMNIFCVRFSCQSRQESYYDS